MRRVNYSTADGKPRVPGGWNAVYAGQAARAAKEKAKAVAEAAEWIETVKARKHGPR